jgi:hypothetical protein
MTKPRHVGVRVGDKTYGLLRRHAEAQGMTLSQYARKMLFLELPHLVAFDEVKEIFEAVRGEKDPKAGITLMHHAHQVVKKAKQALVKSKAFRLKLGEECYETALRELEAADRDIGERIALISGTIEMVTTLKKLGGLES